MPKKLEERLMREAKLKNYGKERTGAYVFGTMRKSGWKPKREQAGAAKIRKPGE